MSEFEESALITELQSKEKIKEYFKSSESNKKKIKLPDGITIGVEIEADNFGLQKELFDGWISKKDGSIKEGLEIVSPILTGSEEGVENIYTACNMLNKLNCVANEKCGGHVYIGASYLSNKQSYNNLLEIWGNTEKILYTISNKPGELTRYGGVSQYAIPISKKIETALERGSINLDSEFELDSFIFQLQGVQESRYSGLNFLNLSIGDTKQTIEFRLANGTIDPDTWIENINLFGGIIAASEKVYQIGQKEETQRTEREQKYLESFEKLKCTQDEISYVLSLLIINRYTLLEKTTSNIFTSGLNKDNIEDNYIIVNRFANELLDKHIRKIKSL